MSNELAGLETSNGDFQMHHLIREEYLEEEDERRQEVGADVGRSVRDSIGMVRVHSCRISRAIG
jgi:hypothetical protein